MNLSQSEIERYAGLLERTIEKYRRENGGKFPTQSELAVITGMSNRYRVSRIISVIREKLGIVVKTRRNVKKRKHYVTSEEVLRIYSLFLETHSGLPSQEELAAKLEVDQSTLSSKVRKINREVNSPPIITRGSADRRKRGKNISFQFVVKGIESYREKWDRLPNQKELADFLGISQHTVSVQIKKANISRLSRGEKFFRTRGDASSEKPKEAAKVDSNSASFSEIRNAVGYLFEKIDSALEKEDDLRLLAERYYSLSIKILRESLTAFKRALLVYLEEERVFLLYDNLQGFCSGESIFIPLSLTDPKLRKYQGSRYISEVILSILVSSLFRSLDIIKDIVGFVIE